MNDRCDRYTLLNASMHFLLACMLHTTVKYCFLCKYILSQNPFFMCMGESSGILGNFRFFKILFPSPGNPIKADPILILLLAADIYNLSLHFCIWKI